MFSLQLIMKSPYCFGSSQTTLASPLQIQMN
jgi:hypothetical protein